MTKAPLFIPAHDAPMRHADGSINVDAYRKIAMIERRKALRQFWSVLAATIKPQASRPVMRGYAARLG
jgi:hypothetical protein